MTDHYDDGRRHAGGQHNLESNASGDDPPGSKPHRSLRDAAEQLSILLPEIYEAAPRSPCTFVEVVLCTASEAGYRPEQCRTGEIEQKLRPELRENVALTKIDTVEGFYRCERVAPRSYHWEFSTGRVPVRAAELCEELGIGFDDAADALAEADGPPPGTPWEEDEIWQRHVADELLKRARGQAGDEEGAGHTSEPEQKSARASKADGPTRRAGREGTGPQGPGRAGAGTEEDDRANTAPIGCEVDSSQEGTNQPSGRSDGDIGGGDERSTPPVEGNSAEGEVRYKPNRERWKSRGTIDQRRYLDERARSPAERLLYLHLLSCARSPDYDTGEAEGMEWVGVSAETMEEEMGAPYHSTRQVWEHSDLIEADPDYVPPNEDGEDGRTRCFRIPQPVLNRWAGLGDGSRRWWLHTEKPERTSPPAPMSTDLSDENNHRYPDLIDRALRVWVDTIQPIRLVPIKEAIVSLDEKNTKTARAQKSGLQLQLRTINRQTQKVEGGVAHVRCAYTPTFAGRIVFKNGGPQGMLGAVKARAYDIKGLTNYDIRSCHTTGLKQVADKLADVGVQIDVSPWEEYPGKYAVAEQTGLPVILVKTAEHAVKYGAVLPSSVEQVKKFYVDDDNDPDDVSNWPSVAQAAERYAADVDAALSTLHDVFSDMRRVVKKIADALLNDYYDATQRGGYMHNPCGVSFNPRDFEEGHERRSKVMAWMLQGLEAAFIHSLTLLSVESDDFNAVANEHDGLIAEGTVPQEAVEVARLMSGFYRAELVEKPHADAEEIAEIYGREKPEKEETVVDRDARYHAQREIPQLTAGEYEEMRSGSDPMPPDPAGNAKSGPRRRQ